MIYKFLHTLFFKIEKFRWNTTYHFYKEKYTIDDDFKFNGNGIIFYGEGEIICKKNSYIGRYSSIQAYKGQEVVIEQNVAISHFVKIYTRNSLANQDFSKKTFNNFKYKCGNVRIEKNCWIGANVFIKEGVTIGENSVIGANSVVTKNIPPNAIAGGVPAKVIKIKSY